MTTDNDARRRAAAAQRGTRDRNVLGSIPAGDLAQAITMIESGRGDHAVVRLRALLRAHGHPEPAAPDSTTWKRPPYPPRTR